MDARQNRVKIAALKKVVAKKKSFLVAPPPPQKPPDGNVTFLLAYSICPLSRVLKVMAFKNAVISLNNLDQREAMLFTINTFFYMIFDFLYKRKNNLKNGTCRFV
jgi:hypothetical protein